MHYSERCCCWTKHLTRSVQLPVLHAVDCSSYDICDVYENTLVEDGNISATPFAFDLI